MNAKVTAIYFIVNSSEDIDNVLYTPIIEPPKFGPDQKKAAQVIQQPPRKRRREQSEDDIEMNNVLDSLAIDG